MYIRFEYIVFFIYLFIFFFFRLEKACQYFLSAMNCLQPLVNIRYVREVVHVHESIFIDVLNLNLLARLL